MIKHDLDWFASKGLTDAPMIAIEYAEHLIPLLTAALEKENDKLYSALEEVICTDHIDDKLRALVDKALNEGE